MKCVRAIQGQWIPNFHVEIEEAVSESNDFTY